MLLLVLILVLVAFGLLVVALLTGNVLSAWLSVAVSVAAAVVLIIDWLQRRSAVKAGRAGADSASNPAPEAPSGDLDPVTEVLPVYTPDVDESAAPERRFDRPAEGQQTVALPAVQPSGSAARPSGAEGTSTPSGGFSSPRVTNRVSEASPVEDSGTRSDDDDGRTDRRSDAEATVVVDIRKAGIGASSADTDSPGGPSSAGSARPEADAADRADRGSAAESPTPGVESPTRGVESPTRGVESPARGDAPAADRQAEPASTGSGAAVAGAAGLAGAAVAGGLAASKDRSDDRTTADTQVVDIGKSGDRNDPASDERRPAGAASAGGDNAQDATSEDRWASASPATAGSSAADRPEVGRAVDAGAAGEGGVGAAGSRPASGPAEREPADDRAGASATGSSTDAEPAGARAAGTRPSEGERPDTTWSDKAADEAPAQEGRAGAWAAGAEAPGGERRGEAPGPEGRPGAWAASAEAPGGERRGGDTWASGAATGDIRPANAWATGAAAASSASGSNAAGSNAAGTAGSAERRPFDARADDPGDHPNGTSSRPAADEGGRPDASAAATDTSESTTGDDQPARTTFGGSGSGTGHDLFAPSQGGGAQVPAQQTGSPYQDEAEPPEESADPALGRVAATVEDEVLVIDEQPRYHLMGCRALRAQQTIPLPAREAVELGFTPCGWCNPVAALGARHPASAR